MFCAPSTLWSVLLTRQAGKPRGWKCVANTFHKTETETLNRNSANGFGWPTLFTRQKQKHSTETLRMALGGQRFSVQSVSVRKTNSQYITTHMVMQDTVVIGYFLSVSLPRSLCLSPSFSLPRSLCEHSFVLTSVIGLFRHDPNVWMIMIHTRLKYIYSVET